jgi:hypothetical protein
MTHEQKAQSYWKEFVKGRNLNTDPIEFAAYCLKQREKELSYWKTRCELAEKYMAAFDSESAPYHKKEYQEFLKNNNQFLNYGNLNTMQQKENQYIIKNTGNLKMKLP